MIEDFMLVRQHYSVITVAFEDESVAEFFDRQIDRGCLSAASQKPPTPAWPLPVQPCLTQSNSVGSAVRLTLSYTFKSLVICLGVPSG